MELRCLCGSYYFLLTHLQYYHENIGAVFCLCACFIFVVDYQVCVCIVRVSKSL